MSTDPPPPSQQSDASTGDATAVAPSHARSASFSSQKSNDSQTAADFIRDQMQLEADAREALPYSIENCTKLLGPLRQAVFACLTCTPVPENVSDSFEPAGVCYACSVQCHGEHTLVEIFTKRNFTCDCGTKRLPTTSPCTLRINPATNTKGGVHSEEPDVNNKYNQNFKNRFCGCECDYDPFQQKGTMFQCLGLGTTETSGCGEDWYHPGCLVGLGPEWFEGMKKKDEKPKQEQAAENVVLPTITEDAETPAETPTETQPPVQTDDTATAVNDEDEDPPMPPGFPEEDDFDGFLCYKCVNSQPWIKKYAGTQGFLPPVFAQQGEGETKKDKSSDKRKAEDDIDGAEVKRVKAEEGSSAAAADAAVPQETSDEAPSTKSACKLDTLPEPPQAFFSLFLKEDFRENLCKCSDCFVSRLNPHPQLLEEEETYEPPLSDGAPSEHGGSTNGSGSLLDRGESALRNVDRVRAIEGVMAYNHLKDKLKPFFQQFAESGQAIGAEDIKAYFAKLRGDEQDIQQAGEAAGASGSGEGSGGDNRREQSGF
ncbi:putative zinc finger in N-recognin-domain-containing protein [Plectosphaerella plurivora]|uniref:Zinc finger in N-recognin-domain-containing protein n=1 Tax=Plectosphaerella plurivora TaxID=936078 RepID=A0A9P9ADT5_9PEZI|nr:putative zinc finger in N-recognin-domain-containing protein [Plectosphaerella plurivora]